MDVWRQHLDDIMGKVLLDQPTLQARIAELGRQITADYRSVDCDELVVIGILRGSVPFMADLIRCIELPLTLDFMAMSSYAHGTRTSGSVRILKDINDAITDKHVLVIEDIIDTGLTLKCLTDLLQARQPRSLNVCTLLDKPSRRLVEIPVRYCGFEIPDEFVVGYGLDLAGHYRHLPFIGVLKPEAYK